jgi:3-oxoacyl-[acyl-carrier protein] reductase
VDLQLEDHRAIVTGSSAGIGEAIARRLAAEGAAVIVHGRRAHAVNAVAEAIRADGGQAEGLTADPRLGRRDTAGLACAVRHQRRGRGPVHPGFLPAMRAAGWGRIVQIGTGEAVNPFPVMPDYAASKAALLNLTASLAKHLDRTGITVNTVSPGIVVTPGVREFYRSEASRRGWGQDWPAIEAGVLTEVLDNPTGRLGRPEEVADLATFVASPLAGYINGANLRIDGGSTAVV